MVLGVSIVLAVGFKISLRGVCLFVNINVLKFHSGFFVYALGCQGVEFSCRPLGVSLRFGTVHFTDLSVSLFLTAPGGMWDLSSPTRAEPVHWKHGVLTAGSPGKSLDIN